MPQNEKSASALFPPVPAGECIARAFNFPGIGLCDVWVTHEIAARPVKQVEGETRESHVSFYTANFSQHTYTARGYVEKRYFLRAAVQLRVRPGSPEEATIRVVLGQLPPGGSTISQ